MLKAVTVKEAQINRLKAEIETADTIIIGAGAGLSTICTNLLVVVVDVGRYGFVMLKYYMPPHGFEEDATFTDSRALFEGLWQ